MRRTWRTYLVIGLALAGYGFVSLWVFTHSEALNEDRPVTIRIAHWELEYGPAEGIAAAIQRYEKFHPQVRVKQMLVPSAGYPRWLRANFSGDNAPDIVEYGAWLNGLSDVPVRYFEPLTTDLAEPNPYNRHTPLEGVSWLKTFSDELLGERMNSPEPGQYYAITLTKGSYRLFCNRDLLRTITGSDRTPQTLAEFRDLWSRVAAYRLAAGRPVMPLAGSRDNAWTLMNIYMGGVTIRLSRELDHDGLMYIYPRQLLWSYLRGEWSFHRPEIRAGLDLMEEFNAQMKPGYQQLSHDEAMREFLRGDALFIFAVTLEATTLRRLANFPIDVLRTPQPDQNDPVVGHFYEGRFADGNSLTYFNFYLNKRGPHKAVAMDFLRFLTSYEGMKLFSDRSGWPPSIREVPIDPEVASYLSPDDGNTYITNYLGCGGNTRALFQRNLYLLAGPNGSVDKFAAAFDGQMPAAARADLQAIGRDAWLAALPQDSRIAALGARMQFTPGNPVPLLRRARLEAAQNQSEARALLITRQLQLVDEEWAQRNRIPRR